MGELIRGLFKLLAVLFDKIPVLNKFKGYRSVLGFLGLAVLVVLRKFGVGSAEILNALEVGFIGFTALALNAKDNE